MKFVNEVMQAVAIIACCRHRDSVLSQLEKSGQGNWFTVPASGVMRSGYWSDVSQAHPCEATAIFGFIEAASLASLLESINVFNEDGSLCADCAAYEWQVMPSHIAPSVKDPVCGRIVSSIEATGHEHNHELFFFCSVGCRDRFVAHPENFVRPPLHLNLRPQISSIG